MFEKKICVCNILRLARFFHGFLIHRSIIWLGQVPNGEVLGSLHRDFLYRPEMLIVAAPMMLKCSLKGRIWTLVLSEILFSLQCSDIWLGDRKSIRPIKKAGCWFVGGDDLTGALHDLRAGCYCRAATE